jgi:hypothetical protein
VLAVGSGAYITPPLDSGVVGHPPSYHASRGSRGREGAGLA